MLAVPMYFYPPDAVYQYVSMLIHYGSLLVRVVFRADLIAVYLFGCVFTGPRL